MKKLIRKMIPKNNRQALYNLFVRPFKHQYKKSYSQSGEDMILNTVFFDVKIGFYIDIGANNPIIQSNTHFFYKKGWSGINIDALPGSMRKFNRLRPRDINLEIPVSDIEETLTYYMFSPSFYNTFSKEVAETHKDISIGTLQLQTEKLSSILEKHVNSRRIDFMTIDVEGLDFRVLKSNDWELFRPKMIVIESFVKGIESISEDEITKFLIGKRYSFYRFTPTNAFYIEDEFYKTRFNL